MTQFPIYLLAPQHVPVLIVITEIQDLELAHCHYIDQGKPYDWI